MTAEAAVRKHIGEAAILKPEEVRLDMKLQDLIDSLDMVELVMALEQEFGIEIPDKFVDTLFEGNPTVQELVNFVENRLTPAS